MYFTLFIVVFQTCRPKELLIGLLEQLEHDDPYSTAESLHLLLNPLQKGKQHLLGYLLEFFCQRVNSNGVISIVPPHLSSSQCCCAWAAARRRLWA